MNSALRTRIKYIIILIFLVLFTVFVIFGLREQARKYYNALQEFVVPKSLEQKEGQMASLLSKEKNVPIPPVQKLKVPQNRAYLGADSGVSPASIRNFELITRRPLAMVNTYIYWGAKSPYFNEVLASQLWLNGTVLIISWNPSRPLLKYPLNQQDYRLYTIFQGKHDDYINKWIVQLKKWRRPVVIRFAPEMNGDWTPWGTQFNTRSDYKRAYRHIFNKFEAAGVKNVSWMWSPNEADENEDITDWYPGDKYVDWVGLSGFNWGIRGIDKRWRSFEQIYHRSFVLLKDINKPISLTELSCIEDEKDSSRKANWILDGYNVNRFKFPKVKIIVWANIISHNIDWRVNSSPSSLAAFRIAVDNSYYLDQAQVSRP